MNSVYVALRLVLIAGLSGLAGSALAGTGALGAADANSVPPAPVGGSTPGSLSPVSGLYLLGSGDEIRVQQPNAEELDGKTARVDESGFVSLPLVGHVHLGGLSTQQAEVLLTEKLNYLLTNPAPVVSITEYRSQPVSVIGAVSTPGVIQLQGRKTLLEVLSQAGGLRQDAAGEVQITRKIRNGRIPLETERLDDSKEFSLARVNLASLFKGNNPEENIIVFPQDVITVPRTDLVYVAGDVHKPGGFPLGTNGGISVLQAVSLAEGLGPAASPKRARIFRTKPNSSEKEEIAVDVSGILAGRQRDVELQPRDLLFIPDSTGKKVTFRSAEAILQIATGLAIWGR